MLLRVLWELLGVSGLTGEAVSAHRHCAEGCLGEVRELNCWPSFGCYCFYENKAVMLRVCSLQLWELAYFASEVQSSEANSVGWR